MSDRPQTGDLEDLFENAPCGYAVLDAQSHIVRANATLLAWLDCKHEDVLGRRFHEVLGMGGQIAFETHFAPLLRIQGFAHEIALDLKGSSGSLTPVIANASELRGPDGAHQLTRLTVFRSADRRAYEQDLLQARHRAEADANHRQQEAILREQFIAVLGHDLRNPLAAIEVGTAMMERDGSLSERNALVSGEIGKAAQRALKMVEDVMDFARGRLGSGIPVEMKECGALDETIEHVIAELRVVNPERQFTVDIAISDPVICDEARIAQLVSNLVGNAIHHGEPGQPIELTARSRDGEFLIEVVNSGEPIPESVRANLFEPFCRGDVQQSREGLGLGLYIVNQIALAHGGEMEVASEDGRTVFRFTMPVRPKEGAANDSAD